MENWKAAPSEDSELSNCVHDQHKCLILDESTSITHLIWPRAPQRRVILQSPAKAFLIPSWGQWFAKNSCNLFLYQCRKTWRLLSPCFWQPLQLQIRPLMRRNMPLRPYSQSPRHLYARMRWQMILFTSLTCPFSDYRFRWITWLRELGPEADDCLWHPPYAIRAKLWRAKWNNCNRVSLTPWVNL